jgi:hypothetical protein
MAFALLYEGSDLNEIAARFAEATASGSGMTQTQRRRLQDYWNAGLSSWQNVPVADYPQYNCSALNGCRAIVVNFGTKADFVALLRQVVVRLPRASVDYFNAIVDDMESSGIVEPWP